MLTQSSKRAVAAAFALSMSVGATGELLQPQAAQAITPAQQAQAIQAIQQAGCGLGFQGTNATITCSTQAVANLAQQQLNTSYLKLYNSRGKSYARYKIGATTEQTKNIPNIYYDPSGPFNLKIMPDDLNSRSIQLTGTRDGFRLTTAFESAGTEFQVEDKWFGSWKDNAFPDLHWDNGQVTANLSLNRDMNLSNASNIGVNGQWSIRSGFDVIPDNYMNRKVSENLNGVFQSYLPSINALITQQLTSLASRVPDARLQNTRFSFSNGNISATIPLNSSSTPSERACNDAENAMGIWSFKDMARNKYARGGVTAEGRNDVVGAVATSVSNPNRAWETFKLYSIPGVEGGRRLQNTIDGRWLETVNATNTLLLHGPVRTCSTTNKDMQWRVVNVPGQRGVYKLQNLRTNKFVKVTGNGLLKANASESQATAFGWNRY